MRRSAFARPGFRLREPEAVTRRAPKIGVTAVRVARGGHRAVPARCLVVPILPGKRRGRKNRCLGVWLLVAPNFVDAAIGRAHSDRPDGVAVLRSDAHDDHDPMRFAGCRNASESERSSYNGYFCRDRVRRDSD